MKYYYIYSAGGGAGDWNGVKRTWKEQMPPLLKERVLLKFGDVFFNHASFSSLIKPQLWSSIHNIREWLASAVNDTSVYSKTEILLDSGTSKIVNFIASNNNNVTSEEIIEKFQKIIEENTVVRKYADIVKQSQVDDAVTFDAPNPFKIRTQSDVTATSFFNTTHHNLLITLSAHYANYLYLLLGKNQKAIMTTINGIWEEHEIYEYFKLLKYKPNKIAVGGLTRAGKKMKAHVEKIHRIIPFANLKKIHFLGCGGIKNSRMIKEVYNGDNISVDNSTPMNRAIDGNTRGTAQSGYFAYLNCKLYRINQDNLEMILSLHDRYSEAFYSTSKMNEILNQVLLHQSGKSCKRTYNARALLSFHNHDVFRVNAL